MRLSTKQIVAGTVALLFVVSTIAAGFVWMQNSEAQPNQVQYDPLDTSSKKVIAKYKDGSLTEGQLNQYLNINAFFDPSVIQQAANIEVKTEIAKVYAAKLYLSKDIKPDEALQKEIDTQWKQLEAQLLAYVNQQGQQHDNISAAIEGKGFTLQQLKDVHRLDLVVEHSLDQRIQELEYTHVKVQHILVAAQSEDAQAMPTEQPQRTFAEAEKRAKQVKERLTKGDKIEALVKEYSDDTGSKAEDGIITGDADSFVPEFAKSAKELPLNEVSDLVKTDYGYHIVKVLERKQAKVAEADEEIKNQKRQQQFTEIGEKELAFESLISNE